MVVLVVISHCRHRSSSSSSSSSDGLSAMTIYDVALPDGATTMAEGLAAEIEKEKTRGDEAETRVLSLMEEGKLSEWFGRWGMIYISHKGEDVIELH